MIHKKFKVISTLGLNARYSTALVNVCMDFESKITIGVHKKTADLKSIMGVMGLAVNYGTIIEVTVDGIDEQEAMNRFAEKVIELKICKEI